MSNKAGQNDEIPTQEKVIELLRDIVDIWLEKDVCPTIITFQ